MNIQIKDNVGLQPDQIIALVKSLLSNRKPKENSFNYGLESHGAIGLFIGFRLDYPIQVRQSNKRTSDKSPIVITIEKHI